MNDTMSVTVGKRPKERLLEITRNGGHAKIVVDSGDQRDGRSELSLFWEELDAIPSLVEQLRRSYGEPTAMDH